MVASVQHGLAGAATGRGPASRIAANRAGGINWPSTARHCRLPSTQMSPARNRSRSASKVATSQVRRSVLPAPSTASRQAGRRKLVGKSCGQYEASKRRKGGGVTPDDMAQIFDIQEYRLEECFGLNRRKRGGLVSVERPKHVREA